MKQTYQPKKRQRKKEHGFRKRMSTKNGRHVLKRRRARGRKKLTAQEMLKKNVLRYRRVFDRIYRKGKSVGGRYVIVFFKENNLDYARTAFLASKKVGNSVMRNRARRLMKEAVRVSSFELPKGYDFIFIARNTIMDAKCRQVQKSIESALKRIGVV